MPEAEQTLSLILLSPCSKRKITTREGWVGEFDWGFLCTPSLNPWSKTSPRSRREVPFYGLNDKLPILLALVCGFQHSLAMLVRGKIWQWTGRSFDG